MTKKEPKPYYVTSSGYYCVKVKVDGVWKKVRYSRYIWELYNGPIPEGYDVHHIDHDKTNDDISNLTILPKCDHNSYHHLGRKYPNRKPHGPEPNRKGWITRRAQSAAKHTETSESKCEGSTTNE